MVTGFGITKELNGTLILTSANTYGGATNVNQGTLNIRHGGTLGDANDDTASGTKVLDNAQLQIQGGITVSQEQLRISGAGISNAGVLQSLSGNNVWGGDVILAKDAGFEPATTPGAATINVVANMLTVDGVISQIVSPMGLTKIGVGTLLLTNSNTYTGVSNVNAGIVRIQKGTGLGTAAGNTVVTTGAGRRDRQRSGQPHRRHHRRAHHPQRPGHHPGQPRRPAQHQRHQ